MENSNEDLIQFFETTKLVPPVLKASLDLYKTHADAHGLKLHNIEPITDELLMSICKNTITLTPEHLVGVYSRLEWEDSGKISREHLVVSECRVSNLKVWLLRLGNSLGRIVTSRKRELDVKVEIPAKEYKLPDVTAAVDKSESATYVDSAVQYVASSYEERCQRMMDLMWFFKNELSYSTVLAPNDGAGVVYRTCQRMGIKCISRDPSPQMVDIARIKGNIVSLGNAEFIAENEGIVVISHSEGLDPGVVAFALSHGRKVIVYETSEIYLGYHKLYRNHEHVRSSFPTTITCMLGPIVKKKNTSWLKAYDLGNEVYVSDPNVLDNLTLLKSLGVAPTIFTMNFKVMEKGLAMGYHVENGTRDVGVYIDHIDRKCYRYFNAIMGITHCHPRWCDRLQLESGVLYFYYGLESKRSVILGGQMYTITPNRYEYGETDIKVVTPSNLHKVKDIRITQLPVSRIEELEYKYLDPVNLKSLPEEDKDIMKLPNFKEYAGRISTHSPYRPPTNKLEGVDEYVFSRVWDNEGVYKIGNLKFYEMMRSWSLNDEVVTYEQLVDRLGRKRPRIFISSRKTINIRGFDPADLIALIEDQHTLEYGGYYIETLYPDMVYYYFTVYNVSDDIPSIHYPISLYPEIIEKLSHSFAQRISSFPYVIKIYDEHVKMKLNMFTKVATVVDRNNGNPVEVRGGDWWRDAYKLAKASLPT